MTIIILKEDAYEDRLYWYGPYSLPAWGRMRSAAARYDSRDEAHDEARDWGITNYALKET